MRVPVLKTFSYSKDGIHPIDAETGTFIDDLPDDLYAGLKAGGFVGEPVAEEISGEEGGDDPEGPDGEGGSPDAGTNSQKGAEAGSGDDNPDIAEIPENWQDLKFAQKKDLIASFSDEKAGSNAEANVLIEAEIVRRQAG